MPTLIKLHSLWRGASVCVLLTGSLCLAWGFSVHAGECVEVGDAGQLLTSGQGTFGLDPLTSIAGTLTAPQDVDLYLVRITDPEAFSAQVVCPGETTAWLYLFKYDGTGVSLSNICNGGRVRVTTRGAFGPGYFWLGITHPGALLLGGPEMLASVWTYNFNGEDLAPDGGGAFRPDYNWVWTPWSPTTTREYVIELSGCLFSNFGPVASHSGSWGRLKSAYR